MKIGEYIKKLRENKKLSINQLSNLSGISSAHISRIENGKRKPSPKMLKKIYPFLGVTYEELMQVAGYIDLNIDNKKEKTQIDKDEQDIAKRLKKLMEELKSTQNPILNGEIASPEAIESIIEALEFGIRQAKKINRKYIPKKYRNN